MARGDWPHGLLVKDAPMAAHVMREIAIKARAELERQDMSQHYLAGLCNLDRSTLRLVLNGYKWPDMVTIVKMEQNLQVNLWPRWWPDSPAAEGASS
jgi:transcriptional regulator with XRE-family HTH domain